MRAPRVDRPPFNGVAHPQIKFTTDQSRTATRTPASETQLKFCFSRRTLSLRPYYISSRTSGSSLLSQLPFIAGLQHDRKGGYQSQAAHARGSQKDSQMLRDSPAHGVARQVEHAAAPEPHVTTLSKHLKPCLPAYKWLRYYPALLLHQLLRPKPRLSMRRTS